MRTATLRRELAELAFNEAGFGRRQIYLAIEIASHAELISQHLTSAHGRGKELPAGNRRSAVGLTIAGLPPMFVRRYRRGGLMRFLVSELYAGTMPRPLHELMVTAAAHRRGLPVVEPLGAIVEAAAPCFYRGWFLTRALEGVTLWNLLLTGDRHIRRKALEEARAGIDRLHEGGLYHADLNFHNLFVCTGEALSVIALDLDKARLYPDALPARMRVANFRRLERSARRLDAAGAVLTREERQILDLN
ncbi:MAG TPA: lipopolysaccharide kinase InaA family protein [Candidatus Binataceae bacterium]|nr:lipopolysaccharide kinase InaA family protein [Candidatus Binataceae bacterium]